MITATLLRQIMPLSADRADLYAAALETARQRWVGSNPRHVAMWLAQIAHESGQLRYVREIASGAAYEGRKNLGMGEAHRIPVEFHVGAAVNRVVAATARKCAENIGTLYPDAA